MKFDGNKYFNKSHLKKGKIGNKTKMKIEYSKYDIIENNNFKKFIAGKELSNTTIKKYVKQIYR